MKRASTLLSHSVPGLWSSVGVGPKQASRINGCPISSTKSTGRSCHRAVSRLEVRVHKQQEILRPR